jgi:hypothetical protein
MSAPEPRDATAFEVRQALAESGCAVCSLTLRSVTRLLQSIAYEQVNDLDLRRALREAGGFCNRHAHVWMREARSVLGTALIYRDVLNAALRELDTPRGGRLRGLLGGSPPNSICPGCTAQTEAERRYLEALLALLKWDAALLDSSDGLCRRHTLMAVRSGGDAGATVARRARESVESLLVELDEVIRKEDYRFRHEPRTPGERTAAARAVSWAAGLDGLVDE